MPAVHTDLDRLGLMTRIDPKAAGLARVTVREFQAMMLATHGKGATIITLTTLTIPRHNKTGIVNGEKVKFPYDGNVLKLARVNGMLNWDYEKSVNNQRMREGVEPTFESLPRSWGSHLTKTPFIAHINPEGDYKLYLKFKVQHSINHEYMTLDGTPLAESAVNPFLPKPKPTRQGIDDEVLERDYEVCNIVGVTFNKLGYIIE